MKPKAKKQLMTNHSTQGRFYTDYEIKQLKMHWTKQAFKYSVYFSMLALRDTFGFGKTRMKRYVEKTMDIFEAYDEEYVSMQDIQDAIKEETGITIL